MWKSLLNAPNWSKTIKSCGRDHRSISIEDFAFAHYFVDAFLEACSRKVVSKAVWRGVLIFLSKLERKVDARVGVVDW